MFLKTRTDRPELMDTLPMSPAHMKETLAFLQRANAYFGGNTIVINHLEKWRKIWAREKTVTVLDVGTGAGDIPLLIHKWACQRNIGMEITGIDVVPEIVAIAQENAAGISAIQIEQMNVESLAWTGKQYDVVIASLFLHHVEHRRQIQMLGILDQLARRAVLVSDLRRSVLSYAAVSAAASLFGNGIARHDGPLSVRRGFTLEELTGLANRSGLPYLKARRQPWFRVSLAGEKEGVDR